MLRSYAVTRANLQKDGSTLLQPSMIRYVEGVFNVVRSVMDARQPSTSAAQPNWADSVVSCGKKITDFLIFFNFSIFTMIQNNISGVSVEGNSRAVPSFDDVAEPDEVS